MCCGGMFGRACSGTLDLVVAAEPLAEPPKLAIDAGATDGLRMGVATWLPVVWGAGRGDGSVAPSSQVLRLGEGVAGILFDCGCGNIGVAAGSRYGTR